MEITYRMMNADDVGRVPLGCQGGVEMTRARIDDVGSAAVLAFDGEQHVAQLQFRRYDHALRSPDGLWDPLYWGDFGDDAPRLPQATLAVFCYHVGQLEDSDARDARYQGRGIGLAMLDFLIDWAVANDFEYLVAKCTPPDRKVMGFMGGQAEAAYVERGFDPVASWVDTQLDEVIKEKNLVSPDADAAVFARVGCCVRKLNQS